MKNALVFRTAQMNIVFELLEKLERKNYNVWCVVQKEALEGIKSKFPQVNYFTIDETFFNYTHFKANKRLMKSLKGISFDTVLVPSSTHNVNSFLEPRRIIYSLGFRKITYWLNYGKALTLPISRSEILLEILLEGEIFKNFIFLLNGIVSFGCLVKNKILK